MDWRHKRVRGYGVRVVNQIPCLFGDAPPDPSISWATRASPSPIRSPLFSVVASFCHGVPKRLVVATCVLPALLGAICHTKPHSPSGFTSHTRASSGSIEPSAPLRDTVASPLAYVLVGTLTDALPWTAVHPVGTFARTAVRTICSTHGLLVWPVCRGWVCSVCIACGNIHGTHTLQGGGEADADSLSVHSQSRESVGGRSRDSVGGRSRAGW
jgi:hypothetical protein